MRTVLQIHSVDEDTYPHSLVPHRGILVLSGYGIKVCVWRGQLRIEDGVGPQRRRGLLHRATSGLKRLVVIGHSGSITLEAIRWLNDVGASYVQIDSDANALASFGPGGHEQPRLRRAQALGLGSTEGLRIGVGLVTRKLAGQREVLSLVGRHVTLPEAADAAIERSLAAVTAATDADALRVAESSAAVAYWSGWASLPVRFARLDSHVVPAHWLTFGSRASALTGQPRSATNPANALLNYLYSILETEATIAARVVGLDPGLGIFHVDTRYRQSLASDLIEAVRPGADRYLLELLTKRTFGARDFYETSKGVCRITPSLAKELVETSGHWRTMAGKVAEDVAHSLLLPPTYEPMPRPITRPRGRAVEGDHSTPRSRPTVVPRRCGVCGGPVVRRQDRTCSASCLARSRLEHGYAGAAKAQERLKELRAEGRDPGKTPKALRKLAASQVRRQAERVAWDLEHPARPDPAVYWSGVFPAVAGISVYQICQRTGLSKGHAWRIRKGLVVPHTRWWPTLLNNVARLPRS